ncbi:hypothetical protein FHL15_007532 [Xylaria flabelliformis]|uniref:Uncharacterized protein n=1 Tax=Xylaria flabelliformis TaxID=2512241 RepID=A0A553HUC5_9PEZI|nr:hypothetical protein FHL15_007532 [Xylaria flabelliformis]
MPRRQKDSGYAGSSNSNTTAPIPDFPTQSIPYVQNERQIPERKRQEVPNTSAAHARGTSIEVPDDDQSEQKAKSTRRNYSIQFAEDARQDRSGRTNGNASARMSQHGTEHQDLRRTRRRSPYPTQESRTRQKAVPIPIPIPASNHHRNVRRDVPRLENDGTNWADDVDDSKGHTNGDNDNDDDDNDEDVTIERNPLADYPRIGRSLTHPKRRTKARGAEPSLLTGGIPRYARICEDTAFAERIQRAVECQGKLSRRQEKKLKQLREEGEKTRIPVFKKPDGQDWGFEMADPGCDGTTVFGEAVVPVYYPREDHPRA